MQKTLSAALILAMLLLITGVLAFAADPATRADAAGHAQPPTPQDCR